MKTGKILIFALTASLAALIAGCDDKLPEVNDENCAFTKIKAMPKDQQQEFSSMCLRRGSYKKSPEVNW